MNNELTRQQEREIADFRLDLALIIGPDDMFPPDSSGDREIRKPVLPYTDGGASLCLASVYSLTEARRKREISIHQREHGVFA